MSSIHNNEPLRHQSQEELAFSRQTEDYLDKSHNTSFSSRSVEQPKQPAPPNTIFNFQSQGNGGFGLMRGKTACFDIPDRRTNQQSKNQQPSTHQSDEQEVPSQTETQQSKTEIYADKQPTKVLKVVSISKNKIAHQQKGHVEESKGGRGKQIRPTSALKRDEISKKDEMKNKFDKTDDATFATLVDKYQTEEALEGVVNDAIYSNDKMNTKGRQPQAMQHQIKESSYIKKPSNERRGLMMKNKSLTFGEEGLVASPFVFKQSSNDFAASPNFVGSSSSPHTKGSNLLNGTGSKVIRLKQSSQTHLDDKCNPNVIPYLSKEHDSLYQQSNCNLPPLLSKLTFCQLTNDSIHGAQISLRETSRGAQTPNQATKQQSKQKQKESNNQIDVLSYTEPKQGGLAKTSSHTYTGIDTKSKPRRKKSDQSSVSLSLQNQTRSALSPTSRKFRQTIGGASNKDGLHLPQDDYIREVISANTSCQEPLFNSRSASYLAMQSHLRDIQTIGADAESQSNYDRLFHQSQWQENNSSWTGVGDGTPKNTLSSQMHAIRQNIQCIQTQKNKKKPATTTISSTKSHQSSANVSEQKKNIGQKIDGQQGKTLRKMHSTEQVDHSKQRLNHRRLSLPGEQLETRAIIDQHLWATNPSPLRQQERPSPQLIAQQNATATNDSQLNQLRPPLGPNVIPKKGVSIFWNNAQQQQAVGGKKQVINRTLTVNEQLLSQQAQQLRQGSFGEPLNGICQQQYAKLRTQVGKSIKVGGKMRSRSNKPHVHDDVASKSSQVVNLQSNQTMSNQLKQLSTNRSGLSSNNIVNNNRQNQSSQLATSSEKLDGRTKNWQVASISKLRIVAGHMSGAPTVSNSPMQIYGSLLQSDIEAPNTPQPQHSPSRHKLMVFQKTRTGLESKEHTKNSDSDNRKFSFSKKLTKTSQVSGSVQFTANNNNNGNAIGSGLHSTSNGDYDRFRNINTFTTAPDNRRGKHRNAETNSCITLPQSSVLSGVSSSVEQSFTPKNMSNKPLVQYRTIEQNNYTQVTQRRIAPNHLSHLAIIPGQKQAKKSSSPQKQQHGVSSAQKSQSRQQCQQQPHTASLQKKLTENYNQSARVSYFTTRNNQTSQQVIAGGMSCTSAGQINNNNNIHQPQPPMKHQLSLQPSSLNLTMAAASCYNNNMTTTQDKAEQIQVQLQDVKRSLNKMKDKNSKLLARIGYLTKEVADRDKLMQKFILNNESETKVKESCVLQSYKSKLASVERKNESLKKTNAAVKAENSQLKQTEGCLNGKLEQLSAEKDMLHNECVKMSQRIFTQQHQRHRQMQIDESTAPVALFVASPPNNQQSHQRADSNHVVQNSSIINIETGTTSNHNNQMSRNDCDMNSVTNHNYLINNSCRPRTTSSQTVRVINNAAQGGIESNHNLPSQILQQQVVQGPEEVQQQNRHISDLVSNQIQIQSNAPNTTTTDQHQPQQTSPQHQQPRSLSPALEAQIIQHKLLERKQTVDQFNHILACDTCNIDGDSMCHFANQEYKHVTIDPIEFSLLYDGQSFKEQKDIFLKVIRDSRSECHQLRLMFLQEMHERMAKDDMSASQRDDLEECKVNGECEQKTTSQNDQDHPDKEDSIEENARRTAYFLEELRSTIIEKDQTINEFKRELQRLYAPKVKIILQITTLQDEAGWKATNENPRANVDRAKNLLRKTFHLSDKVLDDSFFKTYMRNFEPVFSSDLAQMTSKVMGALRKAQTKKQKATTQIENEEDREQIIIVEEATQAESYENALSSMHKVVNVQDLGIRDPKLLQFARYLAYQTLKSDDKLSIEILGGSYSAESPNFGGASFSLSECVKQLATQRSTQDSEQIDEVNINSLMTKLHSSQALNIFFSTVKTHQVSDPKNGPSADEPQVSNDQYLKTTALTTSTTPVLLDCRTFRTLLTNHADCIEEERAAEQLLNLFKVRTIGEHMVDLNELYKVMATTTANNNDYHQPMSAQLSQQSRKQLLFDQADGQCSQT